MKAVDKFEYRRGFKFSTYATCDSPGHHPLHCRSGAHHPFWHMIETINKMNRLVRSHMQEFGVEPDIATLSGRLDDERIMRIKKISKEPRSMESPVGEDEDSQLGDLIEDHDAISPFESATRSNLSQLVSDMMQSLTPKERTVLSLRAGLGMSSDHTLEEVGKQMGLTRERVRQIEAQALRKMRHPQYADLLRSFIVD